ncbi:uncharacterized protein [Elaeis guineensis]|uniref:uncharacterized protein isoform X3 n=1 Tax=Elaeis guineensis var. tenera TaxID=51953 RepID=UPI003C6D2C12
MAKQPGRNNPTIIYFLYTLVQDWNLQKAHAKEWARWEKRLCEFLLGNANYLSSIRIITTREFQHDILLSLDIDACLISTGVNHKQFFSQDGCHLLILYDILKLEGTDGIQVSEAAFTVEVAGKDLIFPWPQSFSFPNDVSKIMVSDGNYGNWFFILSTISQRLSSLLSINIPYDVSPTDGK